MDALEELDHPGALRAEREITEHPSSSQKELWAEPDPLRRIVGPSEVPVYTDCPAQGIENTRDEDTPLAMTERGIKPKRLDR
jgi:hypothetical protein